MNRLVSLFQAAGAFGTATTLLERGLRPELIFGVELRERLMGASALEIGGPSPKFMPAGLLPLYDVLGRIDNVTFANETIWEGRLGNGFEPVPGVRGRQFIVDGTDLAEIEPYDAVLSSHVIEHLANPIKGLREWRRVLKPAGVLVMIAPHGRYTFDRKRPLTTLDHLIQDFQRDTPEDDVTHAEEVLRLHDVRRDPGLDGHEELRTRIANNAKLRSMHHHVFDEHLLKNAIEYAGFRVEHLTFKRPFDIVALATRE